MEFPRQQDSVETQRWGYLRTVDTQVAARPGGAPLPAGVSDTDNDAPTELYTQYVVTLNSNDLETGETATATADNPFGSSLDDQLNVSTKPYSPTVLRLMEIDRSPTGEGHEGTLILTDTNSNFLDNKTITVTQADGTNWTVTTDSEGRASVTWDGMTLRARYDGDVWDTGPDNPYYKGDSILYLLPPGDVAFVAAGTVGEYISGAINNTLIFVEWLALGIFAFWYVRMRRRTTKTRRREESMSSVGGFVEPFLRIYQIAEVLGRYGMLIALVVGVIGWFHASKDARSMDRYRGWLSAAQVGSSPSLASTSSTTSSSSWGLDSSPPAGPTARSRSTGKLDLTTRNCPQSRT
ncbi:hypothetical protein C2R22_23125 (plasmid) [Salinigranum rubrum]|uniref:Uncharacterized protein n=2 Tax=Salinigranum rubrum TaxID=755307 RepID=A0A2I8VR93_9EURY|nr:hypothetical protein C2R22_23125 [Salinigranum rubrum]